MQNPLYIKLRQGDEVVSTEVLSPNSNGFVSFLIVTKKGFLYVCYVNPDDEVAKIVSLRNEQPNAN